MKAWATVAAALAGVAIFLVCTDPPSDPGDDSRPYPQPAPEVSRSRQPATLPVQPSPARDPRENEQYTVTFHAEWLEGPTMEVSWEVGTKSSTFFQLSTPWSREVRGVAPGEMAIVTVDPGEFPIGIRIKCWITGRKDKMLPAPIGAQNPMTVEAGPCWAIAMVG